MTDRMNHEMPPEAVAFQHEFESFRALPEGQKHRHVKKLMMAAVKCKYLGTLGPVLATAEYGMGFYPRCFEWAIRLLVAFYRHVRYRNRPLWNDYHMCLWLLSRERWAVERLYEHLRRANRKGISGQAFTGDWMVRSVCEQDAEFAAEWYRIVTERGCWSKTPIGEFAASLGSDPAILECARMLHPEANDAA